MELKILLQGIINFVRVKQFIIAEGKPLSLSICKDEANIAKWCNILEYRKSQEARCNEYFVSYVIKMAKTMCSYIHGIQQTQQDSNVYFTVK